jgi:hypothetical protein
MNRTADVVTDADMGVGFPERDFDGYALFGAIEGIAPYRAIKLILFLGGLDGYDWGMAHIPPDPAYAFYEIQLIGDTEAYRRFQPLRRSDLRAARSHLDIRLDDRVALSGTTSSWRWRMAMPDDDVEVALEATASHVLWSPNLVHKGTSWITPAFPDFRYEGTVRIGGTTADVRGVATFDHPIGTLRPTLRSPGVGYWEWDGFQVGDEHGLFAWHAVDGLGSTVVSEAITTYPDGERHVGPLTLEYRAFEDWAGTSVPSAWRCRVDADHGIFEYDVRASLIKPVSGAGSPGEAFPSPVLDLDGTFTAHGADPRRITGFGTGESIQSLLDPRTRRPKQPW